MASNPTNLSGPTWALNRWATGGLLLAVVALLVADVLAHITTARLHDSHARVLALHDRTHGVQEVSRRLRDAETARWNYLLTGEAERIEPFRTARANAVAAVRSLRAPFEDGCRGRVGRLEQLVERRLDELDLAIDRRRSQGVDAALRLAAAGEGAAVMKELEPMIEDLLKEAKTQGAAGAADARGWLWRCYLGIVVGNLAALGLLAAVAILLNRSALRQQQIEQSLRQSHERMEGALSEEMAGRRRTEERFIQAQKMEAIGRLAAGVAHDFNNLLTVIIGFSDYLQNRLPIGSTERSAAEEILKAGDRSAELTRQLLALSRQQPTAPQRLDLNAIVASLAKALPRLLGNDVQVSRHLRPDIHPVLADPGQIEQVLLNLAVNARDAMPDGGYFTIETQNVELDASYTRQHAGLEPGPYVLLSVSDTGCGMTREVRDHLFEPFFTTKEKGKGTGLGLATVYSVVRQCGGHIAVYSEPGRGTTFKIFLPPCADATIAPYSTPPPPLLRTGSETVLLVEDDDSVRALVSAVLRQHGYTVLQASDGPAALQLVEHQDVTIHLLVIDVVLPHLNGREVAERLQRARPGLKVLFLSGYTSHAVVRHGVLDAEMAFLQKPFTPHALAYRVRDVLDGQRTARAATQD